MMSEWQYISCGVYMGLHHQVDADLEIKAYYAGHVLGAAMFQVKVRNQSIVYTVSSSAGYLILAPIVFLLSSLICPIC